MTNLRESFFKMDNLNWKFGNQQKSIIFNIDILLLTKLVFNLIFHSSILYILLATFRSIF